MALKPIGLGINGSGKRKSESWIESFVDHTDNLEAPEIFRRWSAIGILAATLERKVWVNVPGSGPLYPNLYTFLVGHAGLGKSKAIKAAVQFYADLPDPRPMTATSVTMASLTDHLVEFKRQVVRHPEPILEYNTAFIVADELSAFMAEYKDNGLIPGLTALYDCGAYSQSRRTKDLRIILERPQVNILTGTTPSNLLLFIPDYAWEQGFTSRILMIYADTKPSINVWKTPIKEPPLDMLYDLAVINMTSGQLAWEPAWAEAMNDWKQTGEKPRPDHPKLKWYNERRYAHLIKLSMISSLDRSNELLLRKEDFARALGWLLDAEQQMSAIFQATGQGLDARVIEDVLHFVQKTGDRGMSEHLVIREIAKRGVPVHNVRRVVEVMEQSGQIKAVSVDARTSNRIFKAL